MAGLDDVTGVGFPFRVDPSTGGLAWAAGDAKVSQDVRVLLATRLGERPMLREYGTQLPGLVHDPNDEVLVELAARQAREAILRWEPRVMPSEITVQREPDEGRVFLALDLTAINDQRRGHVSVPLA
ncbi:MAG: GPW/gp25 family protein [Acidimicrobiia bacterium]|jgi:phage baseplate assembly protein W|nr:GPW/gp25 family protein [Acidimicrobiia bacterium]